MSQNMFNEQESKFIPEDQQIERPKKQPVVEFVKEKNQEIKEEIIGIRRNIHQNPELGFQEFETAKLVADHLESLGLEVHKEIAGTGVVGILRGQSSERAVLLRADMDALPIPEESGEKFCSQKSNISHTCGHDAHVAALLSAAEVLKQVKDNYGLKGDVIFAFQPNEERTVKKSGAVAIMRFLAKQELWEKIDSVFACHVSANVPLGTVRLHSGVFLSGSSRFDIVIKGPGGHASRVHEIPNPIVLGASVVQKISLEFGGIRPEATPRESIISPTIFHSGKTKNIIPAEAEIGGSIRILKPDAKLEKQKIFQKTREIVEEIIDPWKEKGVDYEIGFDVGTRPLFYTEEMVNQAKSIVKKSIDGALFEAGRAAGSDDFSFFFEKFQGKQIPGFYYFVGAANPEKGIPLQQHHQPKFKIDEEVISQMSSILTISALDTLEKKK